MKPRSEADNFRKNRRFPIVDCNYQDFSHDRFRGLPEKRDPSFLNISREYFRYEARRNFLAEAAFFLAFVAILTLTFISGAIVIIRFLNLPES
jgi:hypothetical protein